MNTTEVMAKDWLIKEKGYAEKDISFNSLATPDFTCKDGKRYEVKFLYGNTLVFTKKQWGKLKKKDIILVFNKQGHHDDFLWENKDNVIYNIKAYESSNRSIIAVSNEFKARLGTHGQFGERFEDILIRLLGDKFMNTATTRKTKKRRKIVKAGTMGKLLGSTEIAELTDSGGKEK